MTNVLASKYNDFLEITKFFFVHRINIFFVSIPDLIPDVVSKIPANEPPNYDYYNEEDYEDYDDNDS